MRAIVILSVVCLGSALFAQSTPESAADRQAQTSAYDPVAEDCWEPARASQAAGRRGDCRGSFVAGFYIGGAVDTFAGSETRRYLNPEDTGDSTLREVAGFDFAYRLFGNRNRLNSDGVPEPFPGRSQLWVYGETVHGIRSKEVECQDANGTPGEHATLPACSQAPDPNVPGTGELLAIIKGATSLEAFVGLRWEVAPINQLLQHSELDRARLYLKAQIGAINVSSGGDSADQHHIGLGAIAVSGPLLGSYLEVGYGRNDLIVTDPRGRFKIDGFLSVHPEAVPLLHKIIGDARIRPFAQLTVDADFGSGADSLQTYFGLDYTFGGTK